MNFKNFTAGINDDGKRIDKALRFLIPGATLSEIYKLIRKNFIKANNKNVKENYRIKANDVISVPDFVFFNIADKNKKNPISPIFKNSNENSCENLKPQTQKLNVAFENEHFLILNKPYGATVHGKENSLEKIAQKYYSQKKTDDSLTFKTGPLHRLDKKTTGLVAFSMSLQGARWFSQNIKNHKIQKIYYAVLEGELKKKDETIFWNDFIENAEKKDGDFFTVNAAPGPDFDSEFNANSDSDFDSESEFAAEFPPDFACASNSNFGSKIFQDFTQTFALDSNSAQDADFVLDSSPNYAATPDFYSNSATISGFAPESAFKFASNADSVFVRNSAPASKFAANSNSALDSNLKSKNQNAKNAELFITPLSYGKINGKTVTFAKIVLKTGRKHQIRAQAALHNVPLLGDKSYGSKENLTKQGFKRDFFLQAAELNIPQNNLGLPRKIKIPLDDEFQFFLNSCGIPKTDI